MIPPHLEKYRCSDTAEEVLPCRFDETKSHDVCYCHALQDGGWCLNTIIPALERVGKLESQVTLLRDALQDAMKWIPVDEFSDALQVVKKAAQALKENE